MGNNRTGVSRTKLAVLTCAPLLVIDDNDDDTASLCLHLLLLPLQVCAATTWAQYRNRGNYCWEFCQIGSRSFSLQLSLFIARMYNLACHVCTTSQKGTTCYTDMCIVFDIKLFVSNLSVLGRLS